MVFVFFLIPIKNHKSLRVVWVYRGFVTTCQQRVSRSIWCMAQQNRKLELPYICRKKILFANTRNKQQRTIKFQTISASWQYCTTMIQSMTSVAKGGTFKSLAQLKITHEYSLRNVAQYATNTNISPFQIYVFFLFLYSVSFLG